MGKTKKTIMISAVFIGTNGSLGYIEGKRYELFLTSKDVIKRQDGSGVCEYSSILTFIQNWTDIKEVQQ